MTIADHKISSKQPEIRQLDEAAINRIAAGEVVERPASAVKELVENALDAGARQISVDYADGGKTLLRVTDDGCGMRPDDLALALTRHATSKIDGSDLTHIESFGFRGEALPSLGAVGRLTITSRADGFDAAEMSVTGGQQGALRPAALSKGTIVTLRDIFFATPARLKFMRSDRAEAMEIASVVKRLAMAEPDVGFTLTDVTGGQSRAIFRAEAAQGTLFDLFQRRLEQVLGRDFTDNAMQVDLTREGFRLWGYSSLPTYSRGTAQAQYLFVNGRPVRDKLLVGALRGAYRDVLAKDRHPVTALHVECAPELVDVNVHPAKTEVRFRDPGLVRGLIVSGLRHALAAEGHRSSSTIAGGLLGAATVEPTPESPRIYQMDRVSQQTASGARPTPMAMPGFAEADMTAARSFTAPEPTEENPTDLPLGAARAQLHENYIVAQTADGMVLVDQHAAHERLVYEKLKTQFAERAVPTQALLIPEIVELPGEGAALLLDEVEELAGLGLMIEAFGPGAIAIREVPALLGQVDGKALLTDILEALTDGQGVATLKSRIDAVLSRISCHGSVRSGRRMRAEEMNALLREMEATPNSGQCNHGRPTYVHLNLSDIERLFGRT